jgi:hypothetical protein
LLSLLYRVSVLLIPFFAPFHAGKSWWDGAGACFGGWKIMNLRGENFLENYVAGFPDCWDNGTLSF